MEMPTVGMDPIFEDRYKEEREYLKGRRALAFPIFAKMGFDEGVAGHISLRDSQDPTLFYVNPFGVAWPLLKASDLILVDQTGTGVDGGPCRLLNTAGRNLDIPTQDARAFHNDLALYESFRGIVLGDEEGRAISQALGNKKTALLQNHRLLTCARTIEAAVFWFMSLERCCHKQLMADCGSK